MISTGLATDGVTFVGALTPNGIMLAPPICFMRSAIDSFFSPISEVASFSAGLAVTAAVTGVGAEAGSSFFIQDAAPSFPTGFAALMAGVADVDDVVLADAETAAFTGTAVVEAAVGADVVVFTGAALLEAGTVALTGAVEGVGSDFFIQDKPADLTGTEAAVAAGAAAGAGVAAAVEVVVVVAGATVEAVVGVVEVAASTFSEVAGAGGVVAVAEASLRLGLDNDRRFGCADGVVFV